MSAQALQPSIDSFTGLIAQVTDRIQERGLDAVLERDLNRWFPAQGPQYRHIVAACEAGVEAGWICNREAGGIRYGRVLKAGPAMHGFSVDVVDMASMWWTWRSSQAHITDTRMGKLI